MSEKSSKNIGLAFKKSGCLSPFFGVDHGLGCCKKRLLTRVSWAETVMTRKIIWCAELWNRFRTGM